MFPNNEKAEKFMIKIMNQKIDNGYREIKGSNKSDKKSIVLNDA